ncbi:MULTISPECIES: acyltransferase family protein [Pseudomonas]|uniref:acyltransferase family protein n=1 Tax=Pseudomonas TaxID=286 RepID=UPI001430C597|nr:MULTISPECIES: acyltransferase [Pseudomonas]UZT95431.1 acyltransferase [Pseudomonas koreensis]
MTIAIEKNFSTRLESLRGLAAICVAVGHSLIWLRFITEPAIWVKSVFDVNGIQASIARALIAVFSGAAAVDLFFVLSGYVLAQSISRRNIDVFALVEYSVRRLLRIIPAYWFSLVLAIICIFVFSDGYVAKEAGTVWFNGWYREPVSTSVVINNALLQSPSLNPNSWTLLVEVLGSLILPFLLLIGGRGGIATTLVMLAIAIALSTIAPGFGWSWAYYFFMFATGVATAKHGDSITSCLTPTMIKILIWFAIVCLLAGSAFFPLVHVLPQDVLFVIGSACLVMLLGGNSIKGNIAILDNRFSQFVGRVSYSFYLLHFMVLYWTATAILELFSEHLLTAYPLAIMLTVAGLTVAASLPLSWASYKYVERPFVTLGRSLFKPRRKKAVTT